MDCKSDLTNPTGFDQLLMTEFAINSSVSSSTGFAPFELNCGYMPTIIGGITPFENAKPGVKRFINQAIKQLGNGARRHYTSRVSSDSAC